MRNVAWFLWLLFHVWNTLLWILDKIQWIMQSSWKSEPGHCQSQRGFDVPFCLCRLVNSKASIKLWSIRESLDSSWTNPCQITRFWCHVEGLVWVVIHFDSDVSVPNGQSFLVDGPCTFCICGLKKNES